MCIAITLAAICSVLCVLKVAQLGDVMSTSSGNCGLQRSAQPLLFKKWGEHLQLSILQQQTICFLI